MVPDPDVVYLDGNSLGRPPRAALERLERTVRHEWAAGLIRSWDHWRHLPARVGDLIADHVLGARPGEVIVGDSTTVNLYKLAVAALDARPGRDVVVVDARDFPTDRFVVQGLAAQRGLTVRWIDSDPVEGVQPEEVAEVLDGRVALVLLSHVHYRSGAVADLPAITALAHRAGALTLWDLSHSGGSVPVGLDAHGVDLAVGCTYKYLNGGPGAPAYAYVRRELQGSVRQPIWGWWGARDLFEMGPVYDPPAGIGQVAVGTPPILPLVCIEEGVRLWAEAGLPALRAKGQALTAYAVELSDAWLAPLGFRLGSPRDPARRGSHVSLCHPRAEEWCRALIAHGVIPDFRRPDAIRLGLAPLTTSFDDVWVGLDRLRRLVAG